MAPLRETQTSAGHTVIHVPKSYFIDIPGYEDNRLSLDDKGRLQCNEMAKNLIKHNARTILRHVPFLSYYLQKDFDLLLTTFKNKCMREASNLNLNVQAPSQSAFWATTPFQIVGAIQQLGRKLDATKHSPVIAPNVGAAMLAALGLAWVYGNDLLLPVSPAVTSDDVLGPIYFDRLTRSLQLVWQTL